MKLTVRPDVRLEGDNNVAGGVTVFGTHGDLRLSARATDETVKGSDLKGCVAIEYAVLGCRSPGIASILLIVDGEVAADRVGR